MKRNRHTEEQIITILKAHERGGPPGQQVVQFDYDASRAGRVPIRLLDDYADRLITDGYEGYAAVVRRNRITHAGCWAHARRKFIEARKVQPKGKTGKADWAINQIRNRYAVEQQAQGMTAEVRQAKLGQLAPGLINRFSRCCRRARWASRCTTSTVWSKRPRSTACPLTSS